MSEVVVGGRTQDLRITIWYPAKTGTTGRSIDFPPDASLFAVGTVGPDAPFADEGRHPVILVSHGFGGSAAGWDGLALPWPSVAMS
jgi:predicted dienelactone hydrolase